MKRARVFAFVVALASLLAGEANAAASSTLPDIPTPYLPSTQVAADEMLRLASVGSRDFVVDLGSGDGRIVTRWRAVWVGN